MNRFEKGITMNDSVKYIEEYYLTLEQLETQSGTSKTRILEMIESQCLPDASYKITRSVQITSLFGSPSESETVLYYNQHSVEKIRTIEVKFKKQSLNEIAQDYSETFYNEYKDLLVKFDGKNNGFSELFSNEDIDEQKARPFILKEWNYVLDGTYGLCTTSASVEEIVRKEIRVKQIDILTNSCTKETLSEIEKAELIELIIDLDKVQALFTPQERPKTSRYKSIDRVVEKYKLNIL